jgi:phosphate transport system permease protein
MNQQDIQAIRAIITRHKRWDMLFGLLGVLALMIGVLTFTALFADMAMKGFERLDYDFMTNFPSDGRAAPASFRLGSARYWSCL